MAKKALYAGWLPPPGETKEFLASRGVELMVHTKGRHCTEEELIELLKDADATLAGGDPYNKRVIDSAPRLKIIARVGVGYDKVDLEAAAAKGIYVTITPVPELAYAMAEHTMALILSFIKRVPQRNNEVRAGVWETTKWWGEMDDLYHLTLGLLGVGRIGAEVAKRAKGFGGNIVYYDVVRRPDLESSLGMRYVSFEELLAQSDILSLHTPLMPQTENIIDARALGKMKKGAILVNTARGALVDERALADALRAGRIGGAALDVFSEEPLSGKHVFYRLGDSVPNLVMTPHSGSGMHTMQAMVRAAAEEVVVVLEGGRPKNPVNSVPGARG